MYRISLTGLVVLMLNGGLLAQTTTNQDTHTYQIFRTQEKITVDGLLDEEVWQSTSKVGEMWYSFPVDDQAVEDEYQTEIMLTYDDRFLYVAAICHGPGPYVIPSLKRDNDQFFQGDVFGISMDPVNERTNGVSFTTNPAGVQQELLFTANTGTRDRISSSAFNRAWDNKWVTNAKQYDDKWVTEMAIPFKSLRYGAGKQWGLNFTRGVTATNSWHSWAPVPRQLTTVDLGYNGALIWEEPPPKAKGNISVIPYILGSTFKDIEDDEDRDNDFEIGGDAKIAVTSNLNLDLTINPDFSQVDVDQQVTNLTTVNIRFPERRLFFLENTDIFSEFAIPPMRPFFSRRIGLDEDGNAVPIQFGGRLSGNINPDLRIGAMSLQTGASDEEPGQNFTSFAVNQRVLGRTFIKAFFHNKQAYIDNEFSSTDFNRAAGGEIDFRSQDGRLQANVGYGGTMMHGVSSDNKSIHGIFSYNNRNYRFYTNFMRVGDNYDPEMGFITLLYHYDAVTETRNRIGYTHNFTTFTYSIFPENPRINNHRFSIRNVFDFTTTGGDVFVWRATTEYSLNMANTSALEFKVEPQYAELFFPFAFTDDEPLNVGEYNWITGGVTYSSDRRKAVFFTLSAEGGGFYNGQRLQVAGDVNLRVQPWGNFAIRMVQNELKFPDPYGSESLTLIGPKIEINMSRDLFWTTFLQWNTQNDNFNINSRFQWQFKPLSNLFIVYTDNYAIEQFGPKNRGVVVKLNHWMNF